MIQYLSRAFETQDNTRVLWVSEMDSLNCKVRYRCYNYAEP